MNELGFTLDQLDTPVLWTDLDKLEANIRTLSGFFREAGVGWRPHIKGIKVSAVALRLQAAGAIGVTCAKVGEAEVMASAGIRDILIANQVVGEKKYPRLAALQQTAEVKVSVDSSATLQGLSRAALDQGVEIGAVVELETGMGRAGIQPGEPAVALSEEVHSTPGLRYCGLMTWEGHTVWTEDPEQKKQEVERSILQMLSTAEQCRRAGLPVPILSCGGSGTYIQSAQVEGITEVQAGGAVFNDVTYRLWGVRTETALFIRTAVSSRPTPDRIICDAGFKAMPAWLSAPEPLGLEGVDHMKMYAEHGVLHLTDPNSAIKVGHTLDFVPAYGDITVFLHDQMYGIRGNRVEEIWPVEGRGKIR